MMGLALFVLLAGCGGSGTKYKEFMPKRIVLIGDEISYLGCTVQNGLCLGGDANDRFTINNSPTANAFGSGDNSRKVPRFNNNWVAQLAANYGLSLSQIVESTAQKDDTVNHTTNTDDKKRRFARQGAKLSDIITQSQSIPSYTAGDMLIIAGGTHDILDALTNPPASGSVTVNATMAPYRTSFLSKFPGGVGTMSADQINQILNAAQGYLDLAKSLIRNGQRNVFIPAVYDFSNSPDLSNPNWVDNTSTTWKGFCQGCDVTTVKQAIYLFDIAMKFDPNAELQALPGQGRVLFATGYASDALYVNLPISLELLADRNKNAVYNISKSVCGRFSAIDFSDLSACYWIGTYTTYTATYIDNGAITSTTYDPTSASDNQYDPVFSTSPPSGYLVGNFVYARDFYLMPTALGQIGNIFYTFMRGFYGW